MKKEEASIIERCLNEMKGWAEKLEEAEKEGDEKELNLAKREILAAQKKVSELL